MTVENISWSISTKECCRPQRVLNRRPPSLQSDGASNWATEACYSPMCDVDLLEISQGTIKPTKWHVRPANTQISLDIRSVWSSLFAIRMKKGWVFSYPDLSFPWTHMLFCWFCRALAEIHRGYSNVWSEYDFYFIEWSEKMYISWVPKARMKYTFFHFIRWKKSHIHDKHLNFLFIIYITFDRRDANLAFARGSRTHSFVPWWWHIRTA